MLRERQNRILAEWALTFVLPNNGCLLRQVLDITHPSNPHPHDAGESFPKVGAIASPSVGEG